MKKLIAPFLALVLMSACGPDELPPIKYVDMPTGRILLNVAKVDIIDHSAFQPSNSPYNTNNFQPTITQTVNRWLKENVQAVGSSGQAIIIIQDASLSARALPTSNDTADRLFKRQQASQYNGHISVQTELHLGNNDGLTDADATRSITLPESPTETELQNAYVTMLTGLNKEFREHFRESIQAHVPWALANGQ